MENKLELLIYHCSATRPNQGFDWKNVKQWHENRWYQGAIGYRCIFHDNGFVKKMRDANINDIVEPNEVTFGAKGINYKSHHFCYMGGMDNFTLMPADTRSDACKEQMAKATFFYIEKMNPDIKIAGHNQFDNKACPSFMAADWLREIGVPEKNILDTDPFGYREYFKYLKRLAKRK